MKCKTCSGIVEERKDRKFLKKHVCPNQDINPWSTPSPITRPREIESRTTRVRTGHTDVYVTIGKIEGRVAEVFAHVRPEGEEKTDPCETAYMEALSRCISKGLQYGIPVEEFISQLQNIQCIPALEATKGRFVKSPADAIARVLEEEKKS